MNINTYINFERLLLLNYKKIGLSDDETLILLITHTLVESGNKFVNPSDLALLCNFTPTKIDVLYSSLTKKGYIDTDILPNGSVITTFKKLTKELFEIVNSSIEDSKEQDEEEDIFSYMEKFFGRLLTPLEYDVIQSWKMKKYSFKLIKSSSEIAAQTGNKSIRYIDTIIFEESKKNELGAEEYQKRQQETVELSRIDWLNK